MNKDEIKRPYDLSESVETLKKMFNPQYEVLKKHNPDFGERENVYEPLKLERIYKEVKNE